MNQDSDRDQPQWLLRAGWLIDGSGKPARRDTGIAVSNGRIRQVFPLGSQQISAVNHRRGDIVDFEEYTVLPGLIDCHVHLFMSATGDRQVRDNQLTAGFDDIQKTIAYHLKNLAAHGIVAVRDGGDRMGHTLRYRTQICTHNGFVPRVKVAGRAWYRPGRYGKLIGRPILPSDSISRALENETDPIDHIKIVNSGLNSLTRFGKQTRPQFSPDDMHAFVDFASRKGLKTMVHANGRDPVIEAVTAGCDSIEHGFFMGRGALDEMTRRKTFWVPTAVTMQAYARQLNPGSLEADNAAKNLAHQLGHITEALDRGVRIALGTDAGSLGVDHGRAVLEELKLFMAAGMTIEQAVCSATANGAELLGLARFGRLEPRKSATFIAVPGTPDDLPDSLENIQAFYVNGKPVEPKKRE